MSKTLVIIRHGKSTWEYEGILDFDRPLKESGIFNTMSIAQKIRSLGITPDLIISSPANRALHTALIVARELLYPLENVRLNTTLYGESDNEILKLIKSIDNQFDRLFIFGHNPVFTDLPNMFLSQTLENLPTSGAVVLQFEATSWMEIKKDKLVKEIVFFPKVP